MKSEDETWRQYAERCASSFGLQVEVLGAFDDYVANGVDEEASAFSACWDWDVSDPDLPDLAQVELAVLHLEFLPGIDPSDWN